MFEEVINDLRALLTNRSSRKNYKHSLFIFLCTWLKSMLSRIKLRKRCLNLFILFNKVFETLNTRLKVFVEESKHSIACPTIKFLNPEEFFMSWWRTGIQYLRSIHYSSNRFTNFSLRLNRLIKNRLLLSRLHNFEFLKLMLPLSLFSFFFFLFTNLF